MEMEASHGQKHVQLQAQIIPGWVAVTLVVADVAFLQSACKVFRSGQELQSVASITPAIALLCSRKSVSSVHCVANPLGSAPVKSLACNQTCCSATGRVA